MFHIKFGKSNSPLGRPAYRGAYGGLGAPIGAPKALHLCPQACIGRPRKGLRSKKQFLGFSFRRPLGALGKHVSSAAYISWPLRIAIFHFFSINA